MGGNLHSKIGAEFELIAYLNQYNDEGIVFRLIEQEKIRLGDIENSNLDERELGYLDELKTLGLSNDAYSINPKKLKNFESKTAKLFFQRRWEEMNIGQSYARFLSKEIDFIESFPHELLKKYEMSIDPLLKCFDEAVGIKQEEMESDWEKVLPYFEDGRPTECKSKIDWFRKIEKETGVKAKTVKTYEYRYTKEQLRK